VREEVVQPDRLRSLRDELEEVQKREEEIKREMKTLTERL
jgi:predicted  nucleic acid-binding Zn-ribbon protein